MERNVMGNKRALLKHFLAALAYRTQKALRGAPEDFADYRAAPNTRTPHELIRHMDGVLGYARTFFIGGKYRPPKLNDFQEAVLHFHEILTDLGNHLNSGSKLHDIKPEQLLQGPVADAMTHAGQIAMLRGMAGSPVPSENFIFADISADNLGYDQPPPARPD
jgi:hypothetical protein